NEGTPPARACEQRDAEARGARLGGVQDVTVRAPGQRGKTAREARIARALDVPMLDPHRPRWTPERGSEAWTHDVHAVARREKPGEQVGTTGRVVREIEGQDRDAEHQAESAPIDP